MQQQYNNDNSGVLFKNESENEKAPKWKGKINVDGKDYRLAAWVRESKAGTKFISLKVSELNDNGSVKPKPKQESFNDLNDDVPW
jgi:uncharacterized protein (DUF736 family)